MIDLWTNLCTAVLDPLLGRLLGLSWTVTLLVVSLATGLLLCVARRFSTDQDLLRRAAEDKKQLKILLRQAKQQRDRETARRIKKTQAMVATRVFSQEGMPLLIVILPVAILATWCYERLEFHCPANGEPVEIVFYGPVSAIGEPMHLLPRDGLKAQAGWIRAVEEGNYGGQPTGIARWTVSATASKVPHKLTFALKGRAYEHELLVGGRTFSKPWKIFDGGQADIQLNMKQARLFGLIPGLGPWLPPWLIGYLVIVIPGAVIFKRLLRTY